jgi:hypothetical protein
MLPCTKVNIKTVVILKQQVSGMIYDIECGVTTYKLREMEGHDPQLLRLKEVSGEGRMLS